MTTVQTWDPERYARNARFVSDLAAPVVELLSPRAGERILDLGCGDGILTAKFAVMGCEVVGVDGSAAQVEAARKLGPDARAMDGQNLSFEGAFDAVFSNAALHWMRNPGGHGCCAKIQRALVDALNRRGMDGEAAVPWYFPTVDEYSMLLKKAGFSIGYIALIPRPTPLPGDITGRLETFGESFTARLPTPERAAYFAEVREALRPGLCDSRGQWTADYVRLRFAATRQD